jgi:hypothetical protein
VPSGLITGFELCSFPGTPPVDTLDSVGFPVGRSRMNTSMVPFFLSFGVSVFAEEKKATYRPSSLSAGSTLCPRGLLAAVGTR